MSDEEIPETASATSSQDDRTVSPTPSSTRPISEWENESASPGRIDGQMQIFRNTWAEVDAWKKELSAQVVSRLTAGRRLPHRPHRSDPQPVNLLPPQCELSLLPPAGRPTPLYEACTPTARNIAYFAPEEGFARFVPYADELEFVQRGFAKGYLDYRFSTLEWDIEEQNRWDPDREIIYWETLHRWQTELGMSQDDIQRSGILEKPLRADDFRRGLLWELVQRDGPQWGNFSNRFTMYKLDDAPAEKDYQGRAQTAYRSICTSLNCMADHLCATHGLAPRELSTKVLPAVESDALGVGEPCGDDCFLLQGDDDDSEGAAPPLSVDDEAELTWLLNWKPDESPCDIAAATHNLTCRQVYAYRYATIPNHQVMPRQDDEVDITQKELDFSEDGDRCQHPGPCSDRNAHCICARNGARKEFFCERNCGCSLTCKRRWAGCACKTKKAGKLCLQQTCPCHARSRECSPELCKCCKGTFFWHPLDTKCANVDIQLSVRAAIDVRPSAFGFGAFAQKAIRKNQFISEYLGESLLNNDYEYTRDIHTKYTGRNYVFSPHSTNTKDTPILLDAVVVGNAARFLNHASETLANVHAITRNVNGDQRIGLWAARNIKRDEELTLFYGSTYWQEGHIAGQAVDEGKSSVMDEPDDEWRPQDDEDEVMSIGY